MTTVIINPGTGQVANATEENAIVNIWHFPRLYVDGSSWVWKYAVLKRKENWIPDAEGVVES